MKYTNSNIRPFWKNPWVISIIILSILGIITGIYGFKGEKGATYLDAIYNTFQLFFTHHYIKDTPGCWIVVSRWLILFVIILLSREVLLLVIPEQYKLLQIRLYYRNHIIFCGLTEQSLQLANKYPNEQRIFIDNNINNPLYRSLSASNAKLIIGDSDSRTILNLANIHKAKKVFIFTGNDVRNIENAKIIFNIVNNKSSAGKVLECFVNIKDLQYKRILNDTKLFTQFYSNFNGRLFNMDETGIKYSLLTYFSLLFNKKNTHILIVGLNARSIVLMENISHFFDTSNYSSKIKITVVEDNGIKTEQFKASYSFLKNFADIRFLNKNIFLVSNDELNLIAPSSICICSQAEQEMIVAMHLWNIDCKDREIPILIFSNEKTSAAQNELPLEKRNIHLISLDEKNNSFDINFSENIEAIAKLNHENYLKNTDKIENYNELPEHFKNSNRNQTIDMYLKLLYLEKRSNETRDELQKRELTESEKELLAKIEHRRWMIEKYVEGWSYGKRNNDKKYRESLINWEKLTNKDKEKDIKSIDLMWKFLKEGQLNEQY
jgi:voltage-gated potassium channel Kch